jgi:hypothetical protein
MDLLQAIVDNNTVHAEVWNAAGQVVSSANLIFNSRKARLDIGAAVPGLYLLQLRDSQGGSYTLKFVVH